mgnify:CR=1 FL=1
MNGLQNYSNLEKFHDGSNNQVYRARRVSDKTPVVIKIPRSEYPSSRELARLYNEYHLLNELQLPALQEIYQEHHAGGSRIQIEVAVGIQKLEPTFKLNGWDPDLLTQFGLGSSRQKVFTAYGVIRDKRTGTALEAKAQAVAILSRQIGVQASVIGFAKIYLLNGILLVSALPLLLIWRTGRARGAGGPPPCPAGREPFHHPRRAGLARRRADRARVSPAGQLSLAVGSGRE